MRGRALGEVPQLISDTALAHGVKQHNIFTFKSPFAGAKYIIEQLQADDLALLMVLSEREEITELLLDKS